METTTQTHSAQQFANFYLHAPYCETKCHYCDFFSLPEDRTAPIERARIYDSILADLVLHKQYFARTADTVFFGGGTPSLIPLETMQAFVSRLPLGDQTEFTMEANPSSITLERAQAWRSMGINRISMGVQALDDERLKWLGRIHNKHEVFAALEALFEAGFRNVSIDYIVGVPNQTTEIIEHELGEALSRFPLIRHVSAYLLTLKTSNSKFDELPSDDEQLAHLRHVRDVLASHGFEQYEISNFARANSRARHNENYWLGGAYLGIGPSAHSFWFADKRRVKNWASLGRYTEMVARHESPIEWTEALSHEQLRLEYIMLRLRRREGLDLSEYSSMFLRDLVVENRSWINLCLQRRLCELDSHLRLIGDGLFLSDQIISKIE